MKRTTMASSIVLGMALYGYTATAAIPIPSSDDREASFLPPPVALTTPAQPEKNPEKEATGVSSKDAIPPILIEGKAEAPSAASAKPPEAPKTEAVKADYQVDYPPSMIREVDPSAPPAQVWTGPLPALPVVPSSAPPLPPVALKAVPANAPAAPARVAPVDLGKPVMAATLPDIDPQSVGLLTIEDGGLGASIWKGTPRALVDRFLFTTTLPTDSAALNVLAHRLLVSTAALPDEVAGSPKPSRSFTALRIEKLVALGRVQDAWKLAAKVKADTIDDITLRLLTEASLVGPDSKEICAKIPSLIAAHAKAGEGAVEWQKALLVCQLRADDIKAVQMGYDMLREQNAADDTFLMLINKNVLADGKKLPTHLTPLRALNLAVMRHLDVPLPPELYARPDAAMIPELLKARAFDEKARLALAEKAATKGILTVDQLAEAYQNTQLAQTDIESALTSGEKGPRLRAILHRAALATESAEKKIELTQHFLSGLEEIVLTGAIGQLAAKMVANVPATSDYREFAPQGARLFALAGQSEKAKDWLDIAKDLAPRFAEVGTQLASHWPLFVLSGMVDEDDYVQGQKDWLMVALTPADAGKERLRRKHAGDTLMLLAAAGYAVPEDAWLRVMDTGAGSKQMMPSPLLLERLAQAAQAGRKGEVVLLALNLSDSSAGDPPVLVTAEIVRALRAIGLESEAKALAREAITRLVVP